MGIPTKKLNSEELFDHLMQDLSSRANMSYEEMARSMVAAEHSRAAREYFLLLAKLDEMLAFARNIGADKDALMKTLISVQHEAEERVEQIDVFEVTKRRLTEQVLNQK